MPSLTNVRLSNFGIVFTRPADTLRHDNQSPYQYLLKLKMRHAVEQLEQAHTLVKQVAEEIGFTDPFHFSRVFRSVLGLSPARFKKLR